MPPFWEFWLGLVATVLLGGGFLGKWLFGGLTEKMRLTFATKEAFEAMEKHSMEEKAELKEFFKEEAAKIRTSMDLAIGSVSSMAAAQASSHAREMSMLQDMVKLSQTDSRDARDKSLAAAHEIELSNERSTGLRELIEQRLKSMEERWDTRLGHIEVLLSYQRRDRAS